MQLILFLILVIQGTISAQYLGTIAEILALDAKIDSLTYNSKYDTTFTEKFRVQGIESNTAIPVDWVAIGFGTGDSGTFSPRSMYLDGNLNSNNLDYQLYDSIATGNILLDFSTASSLNDLIVINVGGLTEKFISKTSFEIEVLSGQKRDVPSGLYKDQPITVELWGLLDINLTGPQTTLSFADLTNMVLLDSMTFKIHTTVDSSIRTTITERDGVYEFDSIPYTMYFGTLDPGEIREADLVVEATTSYSIDVESKRGNRLRHTQVDEYVDYIFYFGDTGTEVTLPEGVLTNLVPTAPRTNPSVAIYPIDIQIGPVIEFVPAGTYKDILSFTITAN
jgi:hypothetical protein